jgi:hypothetical protein
VEKVMSENCRTRGPFKNRPTPLPSIRPRLRARPRR